MWLQAPVVAGVGVRYAGGGHVVARPSDVEYVEVAINDGRRGLVLKIRLCEGVYPREAIVHTESLEILLHRILDDLRRLC